MKASEFFDVPENVNYIKKVSKSLYVNSVLVYYMELEDYTQDQLLEISRKIKYYNSEKSKLNTFLIMCLKNKHNEIYRNMVSNKRKINNPLFLHYLDYQNSNDSNTHDFVPSKDDENSLSYILDGYKNILTDEDLEILKHKYYGYSGKEIGFIMGTNVKHVEYRMACIRKKLNEFRESSEN